MSDKTAPAVDLTPNERQQFGKLPRENYKLRIIDEPEFKLSKKDNPMLVFSFEIVEPSTRVVDGESQTVAGIKLPFWAVFLIDEKKGTEVNYSLTKIHKACNLPMQFMRDESTGLPVDDSGVPIRYKGLELWARCSSKQVTTTSEDTGEVLKNPLTGEALTGWRYEIDEIYN